MGNGTYPGKLLFTLFVDIPQNPCALPPTVTHKQRFISMARLDAHQFTGEVQVHPS